MCLHIYLNVICSPNDAGIDSHMYNNKHFDKKYQNILTNQFLCVILLIAL